ncbi:unnamed protein product [Rhizophagus irregularis]|nr:unnamed protein product [Rhizophagus irregularis]
MKKNLIVMLLNNWNKKARMISNGVFVGATEKSTDGKKNKDKRCRDMMLAKKDDGQAIANFSFGNHHITC